MVWVALKNRIALDPAKLMEDLGKKIEAGLNNITKKTWVGAYEKVQQQEHKYLLQAPAEAAVDEVPSVQNTSDDHEYTVSL